jgi:hypothetical protein
MNKYVISSLEAVLRPVDEDDGSIVKCEDHMKVFREMVGTEDDLVFDVRLFPGGETFECADCVPAGKERSDQARRERAPALFRLVLWNQLNRLMEIVARLATVVILVVVVMSLALIETAPALAPYVGRYWEVRVGQAVVMVVVVYVVLTRGPRWLITGRLVKWSRHSIAVGSHSRPRL